MLPVGCIASVVLGFPILYNDVGEQMNIPYDPQQVDPLLDQILGVDAPIDLMVDRLRELKEVIYASIPDKQRQSRGITWVVHTISELLNENSHSEKHIKNLAIRFYEYIEQSDLLVGVPIFLMARYGTNHVEEVLGFYTEVATSDAWVVREFAAAGFRQLITPNRTIVHPWLKQMARQRDPNRRRFASETLRPVTFLNWIQKEPAYSLDVLQLLFHEAHPYPRTSVGNNLSDLSRRNPELVYALAQDLVESGDKNSYWIAYRACRNLVKKDPQRVMDILQTTEYHYKDRRYQK
jgi:3-methyladenine DNA glycosylase AlkC